MIAEFFIWVLAGVVKLVLWLFPTGPDPAPVLGGVNSAIGRVYAGAAGLGAWIPWSSVAAALAVVSAVLLTAGAVKLVRIVASYLTLGGGSAA